MNLKLWLSQKYYVLIDSKTGECRSEYLEGAMGFVIKCHPARANGQSIAWKIPRLIADSLRENSYISQLLLREEENVGQMRPGSGLMISQAMANPFQARVLGVTKTDQPQPNHAATKILLVSFSKGNPPRFCCMEEIGLTDGIDRQTSATNPNALPEEIRKNWRRICVSIVSNADMACFVHDSKKSINIEQDEISLLNNSPLIQKTVVGWYANLPSVVYEWAEGTLQDAISNNKRGNWGYHDHYELIKSILTGLVSIHKKDMLHADLRPANVMYKSDPKSASDYVLTDYGSLTPEITPDSTTPTDGEQTILRTISNARTSSFYAPERRNGFEHEDADVAYIFDQSSGMNSKFLVVIGWHKELTNWIDDEGFKNHITAAKHTQRHSRLEKGDRIRLREYVFHVERAHITKYPQGNPTGKTNKKEASFTLIACSKEVWKVFSERIVIAIPHEDLNAPSAPAPFWNEFSGKSSPVKLPLPKIVELPQWRTPTDIYAIGALSLYSIYPRDYSTPGALAKSEKDFSELLAALSNTFYFQTVWKNIQQFATEIESALEKVGDDISKTSFAEQQVAWELPNKTSNPPIWQVALHVSRDITQTAPGAADLLRTAFNRKTAHFCLYIHFLLSCLHRRSTLLPQHSNVQNENFPFCRDRLSSENPATPAMNALARVKLLSSVKYDRLSRIECSPDQIIKYEPKSDATIIMENRKLNEHIKQLRSYVETIESRALQARNDLTDLANLGILRFLWRGRGYGRLRTIAQGLRMHATQKLLPSTRNINGTISGNNGQASVRQDSEADAS